MRSDEQILKEFSLTGDTQLIGELFKKYQKDIFGIAYYYLKDYEKSLDTVSDVFVVIIQTMKDKEVSNFKKWAFAICRNQALKKLRDNKTFINLTESLNLSVENVPQQVYSDKLIEKISDFIASLKDKQKTCIEQFYLKGKSYNIISKEFGMTLKEVKSNIQNGKRNLKLLILQSSLELDEEIRK